MRPVDLLPCVIAQRLFHLVGQVFTFVNYSLVEITIVVESILILVDADHSSLGSCCFRSFLVDRYFIIRSEPKGLLVSSLPGSPSVVFASRLFFRHLVFILK